jgi:hypothetical protein
MPEQPGTPACCLINKCILNITHQAITSIVRAGDKSKLCAASNRFKKKRTQTQLKKNGVNKMQQVMDGISYNATVFESQNNHSGYRICLTKIWFC